MKKVLLVLSIIMTCFLIGCKAKYNMISDVDEFDSLFTGAMKYDIRSDEECELGHIPGFMCMGSETEEKLISNIDTIAKDKYQNIILIGDKEKVESIFKELSKKGYKSLYTFEDGFEGYANKKGEDFKPEEGCGC